MVGILLFKMISAITKYKYIHCLCGECLVSFDQIYFLQDRNGHLTLEIDNLAGYGKTWLFITLDQGNSSNSSDNNNSGGGFGGNDDDIDGEEILLNESFQKYKEYKLDDPSSLSTFNKRVLYLQCKACQRKIGSHRIRLKSRIGYSLCLSERAVTIQYDDPLNSWIDALKHYSGEIPVIQEEEIEKKTIGKATVVNINSNSINNSNINSTKSTTYSCSSSSSLPSVTKSYRPTTYPKDLFPTPPSLKGFDPFDYQIESFHVILKQNTILILPTGMGKTCISTLVLLEMKKLNGDVIETSIDDDDELFDINPQQHKQYAKRISLFLVDRVPLARQQANAIGSQTDLKVLVCHGEIKTRELLQQIYQRDYDVLVGTVDSIINVIDDGYLDITDFYFITFDEIHHATAYAHGYCKIMERLNRVDYNLRPRILGLTASVVESSSNLVDCMQKIKALQKNMDSLVFKPFLSVEGNEPTQPTIHSIQAAPYQDVFLKEIYSCLSKFIEQLTNEIGYIDLDLGNIGYNNNRFFYGLKKLQDRIVSMKSSSLDIKIKNIMKIYDLISVLITQGPYSTLLQFKELELQLQSTVITPFIENIERVYPIDTVPSSCLRFEKLLEVLSHSVSMDNMVPDEDFRCVIFVETRACARSLIVLLQNSKYADLRPQMFVGHSQFDGMSVNRQMDVIQDFIDGDCQLLVSTSVLEEGIDIKKINTVICYEGISTLRSFIQRRGRVRSKDDNTTFSILTNNDQVQSLQDIIRQENIMNASINELIKLKVIQDRRNELKYKNSRETNTVAVIREKRVQLLTMSFHCVADIDAFKSIIESKYKTSLFGISESYEPDKDEFKSHYLIVQFKKPNHGIPVFMYNVYESLVKSSMLFWMYQSNPYLENGKSDGYNYRVNSLFTYGNLRTPNTFFSKIISYPDCELRLRKTQFEFDAGNYHCWQRYQNIENYVVYDSTIGEDQKDYLYIFCIRPCVVNEQKRSGYRIVHNRVQSPFSDSFTYCFCIDRNNREPLTNALSNVGFQIYYGPIKVEHDRNVFDDQYPIRSVYDVGNPEISYLLHALATTKRFGSFEMNAGFIMKIKHIVQAGELEKAKALIQYAMYSQGHKFISNDTIFENIDRATSTFRDIHSVPLNPNNLITKAVSITPSRTIVHAPEEKLGCRILRHFGPQHFLLVRFCDENEEKFGFLSPPLQKYIRGILIDGIHLNGKHYSYLGSSKSQQRESTVWMVEKISVATIRQWAGSINKDPRVFLFRFALQFSTTVPFEYIPPHHFHRIDDKFIGKYNFTDGCGFIGKSLLDRAIKKLNYEPQTCAIQVRIGGCKGVLVLNERLHDPEGIYLPPSMIKYETPEIEMHRTLEIISTNTANKCQLNKQIISLLGYLGTSDKYFMKLLMNHLISSCQLIYDWDMSKGLINKFIPESINQDYLMEDIFIKRILNIHYKKNMETILEKLSITVEKSRNLLGACDPYNVLKENQVFCQIVEVEEDGSRVPRVLQGNIVVCKPPCLLPSDIRIVQAVDVPSLRNHINILLFSTQGSGAPVPFQCSGSDLDGDRYGVFYDPKIIPTEFPMETLMEDPEELEKRPDPLIFYSSSLAEKFVENLSKGFLSQIANHHLALCDLFDPAHHLCIQLAKEHFIEVDAAKTGVHGEVSKECREIVKKYGYPDFMDKGDPNKEYYPSSKIMGKLYEHIKSTHFIGDFLHEKQVKSEHLAPDLEKYIPNAKEVYKNYQKTINSLKNRFGAKAEEELMVGFYSESRARHSLSERVKEEIKLLYLQEKEKLQDEFLREFFTESLQNTLLIHRDEIEKKISAWYYVAYSSDVSEKERKNSVLSFYTFVSVFRSINKLGYNQHKIRTNNILNHFEEKQTQLLNSYKKQLSLAQKIQTYLHLSKKTPFSKCTVSISGSVSTMLFDPKEINLDLVININQDHTFTVKALLLKVEEILKASNISARKYKMIDNSLLSFRLSDQLVRITFGGPTHQSYPQMLRLIDSNPFLLPFIHIILDWGKESNILNFGKNTVIEKDEKIQRLNRWKLSWMVIDYFNKNKYLKPYSDIIKDPNTSGIVDGNQPVTYWEDVFTRSLRFNFTIDTKVGYLGEKFLNFFKEMTKTFGKLLYKNNNTPYSVYYPFIDGKLVFSLDKTGILQTHQYLHNEFFNGFHCSSNSSDIGEFLLNSTSKSNQTKRVVIPQRKELGHSFFNTLKHNIEKNYNCSFNYEFKTKKRNKRILIEISGSNFFVVQATISVRKQIGGVVHQPQEIRIDEDDIDEYHDLRGYYTDEYINEFIF